MVVKKVNKAYSDVQGWRKEFVEYPKIVCALCDSMRVWRGAARRSISWSSFIFMNDLFTKRTHKTAWVVWTTFYSKRTNPPNSYLPVGTFRNITFHTTDPWLVIAFLVSLDMFWVGYFFLVKSIQVTFFDLCCLGFLFHHSDICTILYDLYVYLGKPKSPFGNPNPLQICVWVKGLREKVRQTTLVLRLFLLLLRVSPLCSSWLFIALPVSLDVFLVCPHGVS